MWGMGIESGYSLYPFTIIIYNWKIKYLHTHNIALRERIRGFLLISKGFIEIIAESNTLQTGL